MVILILIGALVALGVPLYLHHRLSQGKGMPSDAPTLSSLPSSWHHHGKATGAAADGGECCGLHQVCEKRAGQALAAPEYFDDEELDAFRGRPADAYTDPEVEAFRDVMLTMRPAEVPLWQLSLEQRGIELPLPLRDELLLIVSEL